MPILRDQTDTILADLLAALHHETLAPADPARLVQDLQIHQIELELQNRELREAQRALEESRDRYVELYDLAPVAYATLSREGRITQMNLAAAALLGVERGPGLDLFLGTRLAPADARALLGNLGRVLATGEEASLEVGLDRPPAPRRALRLTLRREHPRPSGASPPGCHAILADITELRDLTARLQERQVQLEHLAEHDPLTGLIVPISAWVVRTAAAQIKAWQDRALLTQAAVWVNLSGRDTQDPNLAAAIAGICGEVGVHPGCLAVEITETWIMTNPDLAAATIQRLQALEITVGIDDFGTGYSSVAALKRLGVHEIKIDRSFVAGLPQDPDDCAIARAMIALGRALGLRVVAEWVETQAQADFLQAEGCGIGQGYLFSAALPAAQFEVYARGGTPV